MAVATKAQEVAVEAAAVSLLFRRVHSSWRTAEPYCLRQMSFIAFRLFAAVTADSPSLSNSPSCLTVRSVRCDGLFPQDCSPSSRNRLHSTKWPSGARWPNIVPGLWKIYGSVFIGRRVPAGVKRLDLFFSDVTRRTRINCTVNNGSLGIGRAFTSDHAAYVYITVRGR